MEYIHDSFKKIASFHERFLEQLNKYLQEESITEWMMKGRAAMALKDPQRRTIP